MWSLCARSRALLQQRSWQRSQVQSTSAVEAKKKKKKRKMRGKGREEGERKQGEVKISRWKGISRVTYQRGKSIEQREATRWKSKRH